MGEGVLSRWGEDNLGICRADQKKKLAVTVAWVHRVLQRGYPDVARLLSTPRHAYRDSGIFTNQARVSTRLGLGQVVFWALYVGGPIQLIWSSNLWGVALFIFNPCWAGPSTGLSLPVLIGL